MRVFFNSILVNDGYIPACVFARVLGKQVNWLHRLAARGYIVTAHEGSRLYVQGPSLVEYYRRNNAHAIAEALLKAFEGVQAEVRTRDAMHIELSAKARGARVKSVQP